MMKFILKIVKSIFLVALLILAASLIESLYAQGPPVLPASPTPPVGKIPWGSPIIYFGIMFFYGLLRMRRTNKDQ